MSNLKSLSSILNDNSVSNKQLLLNNSTSNSSSMINESTPDTNSKLDPSSMKQIDSSKVDLHLVTTLNQELVELGFQSLMKNYSNLVKSASDLVQRLRRNTIQMEKIQDQYVYLFCF